VKDIVVNKVQSIQRCIRRAREELELAGTGFREDYTRQDAAILNITRACEQALDLTNHIIKTHKMGIPASSRESFDLLERQGVIPNDLAVKLRKMIGFRNTAVHQYQQLNIDIVIEIIRSGLDDLIAFTDAIIGFVDDTES
jgi:uncharacterized protein YutE (UPF0331/DUF86 family)